MNSKLVLVLIASLLLCIVSIQTVKSQSHPTVYIRADGSVDPSTAPVQKAGDVYTFTGDINGDVTVERDNVIINGAGYAVGGIVTTGGSGSQTSTTIFGIDLMQRSNVTVRNVTGPIIMANSSNCIIYGSKCSLIRMDYSFNNSIVGNSITGSGDVGIMFIGSYNNSIIGNYVANNDRGINFLSSENNTIYENTIADNKVYSLNLWESSIHNTIIRNNFISGSGDITKQVGGGDSIPNRWDDGTVGNYWSDNTNGSTYAIQFLVLKDGLMKADYDNHAQTQPFTIPEYPLPQSTALFPTSSPSPSPSASPSSTASPSSPPSPSPSFTEKPSLEPQQTPISSIKLLAVIFVAVAIMAIAVAVMQKTRNKRVS